MRSPAMAGPPLLPGLMAAVDLDAQTRDRGVVIWDEFDARDDTLGDRQARAALGITVDQDGVLDLRQLGRAGQRRVGVEEAVVVELEDGEVDARGDGLDGGGEFVAGLVGLDLDLAGVEDDVGVGEDAVAVDDHAAAGVVLGGLLGPGLVRIGVTHGGEHLDHRGLDGGRSGRGVRLDLLGDRAGGGRGRGDVPAAGKRKGRCECPTGSAPGQRRMP